jgi:AcrR family transcriptional regulator
MPKIINNLDEIIFEKSNELFCSSGYDNVDMKAIAKSCNIAVGTLYNYYPNKKSIYMGVLKKSWNETFEKIKTLDYYDKEISLKKLIDILYDDILHRKGLTKDIGVLSQRGDEDFIQFEKYILKVIQTCIYRIKGSYDYEYETMDIKLSVLFLNSIVTLAHNYSNDGDENKDIIYKMISTIIKEQ